MSTGVAGAEGSWRGALQMGVSRRHAVARGRSRARWNANRSHLTARHANDGACLDLRASGRETCDSRRADGAAQEVRRAAVRRQGGGARRRAAAHPNRTRWERAPALLAPRQRLVLEVEPQIGACRQHGRERAAAASVAAETAAMATETTAGTAVVAVAAVEAVCARARQRAAGFVRAEDGLAGWRGAAYMYR